MMRLHASLAVLVPLGDRAIADDPVSTAVPGQPQAMSFIFPTAPNISPAHLQSSVGPMVTSQSDSHIPSASNAAQSTQPTSAPAPATPPTEPAHGAPNVHVSHEATTPVAVGSLNTTNESAIVHSLEFYKKKDSDDYAIIKAALLSARGDELLHVGTIFPQLVSHEINVYLYMALQEWQLLHPATGGFGAFTVPFLVVTY
jgi:hypothetical protein